MTPLTSADVGQQKCLNLCDLQPELISQTDTKRLKNHFDDALLKQVTAEQLTNFPVT